MKNTPIKNFIHEIKKISLTAQEKSHLFATLNKHADSHQYSVFTWSLYFQSLRLGKPLTYVVASFLIIMLASGTTVFASGASLPGDILYPVKIHISEAVQVALAPSVEAKQRIQVEHVEERLNEAEALAVQGRLATTTTIDIKTNLDSQIDNVKGKLSKKNQDMLEVALSAHRSILESIKNDSNTEQKVHIASIQATVHEKNSRNTKNEDTQSDVKIVTVQKVKPSMMSETNARTFGERKSKVQQVLQAVNQKIDDSAFAYSTNVSSLERDIFNTASTTIENARINLQRAEDVYSKNNADEADAFIKVSEQSAEEAAISVDRGLELGKIKRQNNNKDK